MVKVPLSPKEEGVVRYGRPSEEILREASDFAADIIVLGVHDRHPTNRGFLGGTADQMARGTAVARSFPRPKSTAGRRGKGRERS
jgi:nucleotide-binding universal stress UspA family protein